MTGDTVYLEGPFGILRLVEMAFSIACIICAALITTTFRRNKESAANRSAVFSGSAFFVFVAVTALVWMTTMFVLFFFQLEPSARLMQPDLILCIIWAILYLVASIVEAIYTRNTHGRFGAQLAACIFGFATVIALLVNIYYLAR